MEILLDILLSPFQGKAGLFLGFNVFVLLMLLLDLGVFQSKDKEPTFTQYGVWTAVWIGLAMVFFGGLYFWGDLLGTGRNQKDMAVEFLSGYLIEKSLSVDNLFVFLLIFQFFKMPPQHQRRILFFGIVGALLLRGAMILAGAALIEQFEWIMYIFGAFLVYTGIKIAMPKHEELDPSTSPAVKLVRRFFPVTEELHGRKFFIRKQDGKLFATPLFLVLVLVEFTDLVFAVDSIPAVFAVTKDPFIVYSSNVFAILGLRSLFFLLQGIMGKFHYLNYGLAVVLSFVGVKMLIIHWVKIPTPISLGVIILSLTVAILASIQKEKKEQEAHHKKT